MPTDPWVAIWPLPNLSLSASFVANDAGLLHMDDPRLELLIGQRHALQLLLGRFTDEFGVPIRPGVMAFREGARSNVATIEAMSALRDAICASALTKSHGLFLRRGRHLENYYSDAFDFYPWHLAKRWLAEDHIRIHADTPGMVGLHRLSMLRPQGSPAVSRWSFEISDCDQPLLNALLSAWERRFSDGVDEATERRLFRSLDMARSALRMPGGADATYLHVGRSIALWVSAFEILAHDGQSSAKKVINLLSRAKFHCEKLAMVEWPVRIGRDDTQLNLPGALYAKLNRARNDFVHGNDIQDDALHFIKGGHNILHYCAPLYRIALSAYLGLEFSHSMPDAHLDPTALGRWISDKLDYENPQKAIELALLTATEQMTNLDKTAQDD